MRGRGTEDGGAALLLLGRLAAPSAPSAPPAARPAPPVSVSGCTCPGSVPGFEHEHPSEPEPLDEPGWWRRGPRDPDAIPWWDARASPERRRVMLAALLIGELQAGIVLRAIYEAVRAQS